MTDSPLKYPEIYSTEDIQQILHIAIARKGNDDELTRTQLWEIAAELDIDTQTLQAAETDWLQLKTIQEKHSAFDLFRRNRFRQKVTKYLIVNTFLVTINLMGAGALTWSLYVLLFWGVGIALSAWKTFYLHGEEYERAFQRWNFHNEFKQTVTGLWQRLYKWWQI